MKGPLASATGRDGNARPRRPRPHAPASNRVATSKRPTRRPSWLSAVAFASSHAVALAKSPVSIAHRSVCSSIAVLAGADRNIDPKRGGVSTCVVIPTAPPNKRVSPPVRPVTPRACARVAPGRPAGYARRSTDKNATTKKQVRS